MLGKFSNAGGLNDWHYYEVVFFLKYISRDLRIFCPKHQNILWPILSPDKLLDSLRYLSIFSSSNLRMNTHFNERRIPNAVFNAVYIWRNVHILKGFGAEKFACFTCLTIYTGSILLLIKLVRVYLPDTCPRRLAQGRFLSGRWCSTLLWPEVSSRKLPIVTLLFVQSGTYSATEKVKELAVDNVNFFYNFWCRSIKI